MSATDLWADAQHLCPMPFDSTYYAAVVEGRDGWKPRSTRTLAGRAGLAVEVKAGELVRLRLPEGAQIVHFFPFNSHDPDERYYAHHTVLIEGFWLTRWSRLFGVMARFRPLLTIIEDTVTPSRRPELARPGRHHPVFGGWCTPADWRFGGGADGIATAWEQFAGLLDGLGQPRRLIKDEVCFFQKVAIDEYSQQLVRLPSDAMPGDRVTLFAELDLTILLALSPYVDGALPASQLAGVEPRPVEVTGFERVADPLAWPYPGDPYPDISLYLDEHGRRADVPAPTRGME